MIGHEILYKWFFICPNSQKCHDTARIKTHSLGKESVHFYYFSTVGGTFFQLHVQNAVDLDFIQVKNFIQVPSGHWWSLWSSLPALDILTRRKFLI